MNRSVDSIVLALAVALIASGCRQAESETGESAQSAVASVDSSQAGLEAAEPRWAPDSPAAVSISGWESVEDFQTELAVFDSVFWEPGDTTSLRQLIRETPLVKGKRVLEIGTGSGLVALCCLHSGAASVVATDVNRKAISNALFNARRLQSENRLDLRLVPLRDTTAWSVIGDDEQFDLIISNPPWEDQRPVTVAEFALYDPGFELLQTLLQGLDQHLAPGGKLLLAYGCVSAVRKVQELAPSVGYQVRILDDRSLDSIPEVFLPGMLLEVTKSPQH